MFTELVRKRRSIRSFKDIEIETEKIDKIIESVLMSPTSRNFKPCEFIIIKDSENLNKLAESKEHGSQFLKNAKLGVVVLSDTEKSDVNVEDASIASIYIQLAAESLGLGSCWIQIRKRFHNDEITAQKYIADFLNIPDNYEIESIIAIGYPKEKREPYTEKDLDYSKIHFEKFN